MVLISKNMNLSKIDAMAKVYSEIAKEEIEVRDLAGTFYGLGSELATLRLLRYFRKNPNAYQGESKNLNCFYFRIER